MSEAMSFHDLANEVMEHGLNEDKLRKYGFRLKPNCNWKDLGRALSEIKVGIPLFIQEVLVYYLEKIPS